MSLKIYGNHVSPFSRTVTFVANHLGVKYDFINVDLFNGEQKKEEYKKINPNQKVPVLVDGDFKLFESNAIITYLVGISNSHESLYPKDLKKRALVDQYLHWHHSNSVKNFGSLFVNSFLYPKVMKKEVNETALKEAKENTESTLKFLDEQLGSSKNLSGDDITLTDIAVGQMLNHIVIAVNVDLSSHKNVEKWLQNLQNLDGWNKNNEGLSGFVSKFK